MTLAEALLTLALAIVAGYATLASYAYKRDISALAKQNEDTKRVAEDNRAKLQALEVEMATSTQRHDGHEQNLDAHEEQDEKAFDRVGRILDEMRRDIKELVGYTRRSSTPPRGFPRQSG